MSDPVGAVQGSSSIIQGAGSAEKAGGAIDTAKTFVSSMDDLKKADPNFYNKIMEGIAQTICKGMRQHQERIKKAMREGRSNSQR